MAEPTVVEPVVEPTSDPTPTPDYFGNDGTLKDGWQGTLEEGLREEKSLQTFKTVGDLAKSFVSTKSMVGKNTMEIPDETSSESVWDIFHKIGGKPETVADYNLKAPDGFPEEVLEKIFPSERLKTWQDRFFAAGISKKSADQFIAHFAQDMLLDLQTMKQVEELEMSELKSGLSQEYGAAMEQKKHFGNIAVEEGTKGDIDFKTRLTGKFGNDPDFIKFSINLGEKFAEGKSPNFSNVPTPADYQEQIDKIRANPLYVKGTQKERMALAAQELAIRELMTPTKTT